MTYDATSRILRFYVNGTLVYQRTIPADEYTILDIPPSADIGYQRLGLGSDPWGAANTPVTYGYVRVYSRALSQQEIQHNYQNPNSPVADGL